MKKDKEEIKVYFSITDGKARRPIDEIQLDMGKMLLKICNEVEIDKRDLFAAMEYLSSRKNQRSQFPLFINRKYRTLERYSSKGIPEKLTFGDGYRCYSRTIQYAIEICIDESYTAVHSDLRKVKKNWREKRGRLLQELFDYAYEAEKNIDYFCSIHDKERKSLKRKEDEITQALLLFSELDKPVQITENGDFIISHDKYIALYQIFKEYPKVIENMQRPLYGLLHKLQKERRKICYYSKTHKSDPL